MPAPSPLDGIDAPVAAMVLACRLRAVPAERPRAKDVAEAMGGAAGLSASRAQVSRL